MTSRPRRKSSLSAKPSEVTEVDLAPAAEPAPAEVSNPKRKKTPADRPPVMTTKVESAAVSPESGNEPVESRAAEDVPRLRTILVPQTADDLVGPQSVRDEFEALDPDRAIREEVVREVRSREPVEQSKKDVLSVKGLAKNIVIFLGGILISWLFFVFAFDAVNGFLRNYLGATIATLIVAFGLYVALFMRPTPISWKASSSKKEEVQRKVVKTSKKPGEWFCSGSGRIEHIFRGYSKDVLFCEMCANKAPWLK